MNENIAALLRLQSVDLKILRLERKLEKSPKALADAQAEVRRYQGLLDEKLKAVKDLQVQINLQEDELKDHEQRIEKLRQQQLQRGIKNKEYQALGHEIQGEKANSSFLQDKILALMEKQEELKAGTDQLQANVEEANAKLKEQKERTEKETAEVRGQLEGLQVKRAEAAEGIDRDLVSRYERILRGKSDIAIVEVLGNICQGCYLALTPQMVLNLRSGSEIVFCQSCTRMLYLP